MTVKELGERMSEREFRMWIGFCAHERKTEALAMERAKQGKEPAPSHVHRPKTIEQAENLLRSFMGSRAPGSARTAP